MENKILQVLIICSKRKENYPELGNTKNQLQAGQSWLRIGNSSNSCGGGREVSHKMARSGPAVAIFCKKYGEEAVAK